MSDNLHPHLIERALSEHLSDCEKHRFSASDCRVCMHQEESEGVSPVVCSVGTTIKMDCSLWSVGVSGDFRGATHLAEMDPLVFSRRFKVRDEFSIAGKSFLTESIVAIQGYYSPCFICLF